MTPISTEQTPLVLKGSEFHSMLVEVASFLASYLDRNPSAPMYDRSRVAEYLRDDVVSNPPPEDGRPLSDLLDILARASAIDVNVSGGNALMAIPGSGLATSAAADLISGVLNRFTALGAVAPGFVALEANILEWMRKLIGLPGTAGGILTSGASMATLSAMLCARTERLPEDFSRGVIYATNQTHPALARALRFIGFPRDALRPVAVDESLRMDVGALRLAILQDRAAGKRPFCIVGNAGTTNTGTVDPLGSLAAVAQCEGLWFHIDAATADFFS